MHTIDELRLLHDNDLRTMADDGEADAIRVLAGRDRAATQLRVTLARVYGRDGMSSAEQWHVLPYLTDTGTIGIVDIAAGTAWDTGIVADDGVVDLGLEDAGTVHAAASMAPGGEGTVRIDGEPVQHAGTAVVDGQVIPPGAPDGWRQIGLPTWRGYTNPAPRRDAVPIAEYRPELWVRPTLVASGLTTCYGRPGDPRRGEHLARAVGGWAAEWPHGLPDWIEGESVTVLDHIAGAHPGYGEHAWQRALRPTRLPRGSDDDELERVAPFVDLWRHHTATVLRRAARYTRPGARKPDATVEEATVLTAAADHLDSGGHPDTYAAVDALRQALTRIGRDSSGTWGVDSAIRGLRRALDAQAARSPWEVADALRDTAVHQVFADAWPAREA